MVGEGAVGQHGGAAEGPQLAGVEAAEGGGEQRGQQLVGAVGFQGEAEQVEQVADERLGDELAFAGDEPVGDAVAVECAADRAAEAAQRRQQDCHAAVGDPVALVRELELARHRVRLLGLPGIPGGLDCGGAATVHHHRPLGSRGLETVDGVERLAAEAVAAVEQDRPGAEAGSEARQDAWGGAAELVGGARWVAGEDHPGAGASQQVEHAELGAVELLRLVDQDRAGPGGQGGEHLGLVFQQVAGLRHQAGLVDRVVEGEQFEVAAVERRHRHPGRAVPLGGECLQVVGAEQAALAGQDEVGQLVGERARADQRCQLAPVDWLLARGVFEHQGAHLGPLFRAAEQARLAAVGQQVGVAGDQPAGEGVPGDAAQGAPSGPQAAAPASRAAAFGEAVEQPLGGGDRGGAVRGEVERAPAWTGEQGVDGCLQQGRLAASGAAEQDQVPGGELFGQSGWRAVW